MKGVFITFEGLDGCGKTTQLTKVAERLQRARVSVTVAREPGGTPVGEAIRRIVLDCATRELEPVAELLLYFASRAQNVAQVIRPALQQGQVVLCDRFTDATLAYQGHARGLGPESVRTLDLLACRGLKPDYTILIDIDPSTSVHRARERNKDAGEDEGRLEQESQKFFTKVRDAYLEIQRAEPRRVHLVNGERTPDSVHREIWDLVTSWGLAKKEKDGL